jgi:hypothetical protein
MAGKKIRVIQFGLGPIGCAIVRLIASRPEYQIVGAIDIAPAKAGKDLGEIAGLDRKLGVKVSSDDSRILNTKAEVVVHCTGSYLAKVEPQLSAIIRAKHNVVSTCEELAEPWSHAAVAKRIDGLAKRSKVAVLGTGINPGFMMDTLPLTLTSICQKVNSVRVSRIVDAAGRREPLQRKIGTGLTVEEFKRKAATKEIRHVGLAESVSLIARTLGWKLDSFEEMIEPVVARDLVRTDFFKVQPGRVTGVHQIGAGIKGGARVIELDLQMSVDAGENLDECWIDGTPEIHSVIHGVHGDLSTAAIAANAIKRVAASPPGLHTMADLPLLAVG